jgi:ATP-GRASP peptide maturase of grasp-with-spasm system
MILIVSDNNEVTTTEVIRWLLQMGKKFIRVHEDEYFEIKVQNKRIFLESHRNQFFLDQITSLWYRRGGLQFKRLKYQNPSIHEHMNEVQHWLEDYVIHTLESKKHINKQSNSDVNKLIVLEVAESLGLDIPKSFLADSTNDVLLHKTIVKPLTGNPTIDDLTDGFEGMMYTSVVESKEESFFMSFFQEKIEKDFEIRVFFLNGRIWSVAIISQNDEQTQIDFRKYNKTTPNRNVPYKLPSAIEAKICKLMDKLDLDCGSIDFMKRNDKYFFLEVNPIGQFLGISKICNYSLEREIALYL